MASSVCFPQLGAMIALVFLWEIRWDVLYNARTDGCPWDAHCSPWAQAGYMALSVGAFLLFTDLAIYWVHRILHWPTVYK